MFQWFFEHIQKNWSVVKNAPAAFGIILVLSLSVGLGAGNFLSQKTIEHLNSEIALNQERLKLKDDWISEYRERLGLSNPQRDLYSLFTRTELQSKCLSLVDRLRSFIAEEKRKDSDLLDSQFVAMSQAKSEEDRKKLWHEYNAQSSHQRNARINLYASTFKIDAILCRDELVSRLQPSLIKKDSFMTYEYPVNFFAYEEVADDLERMAKLLTHSDGL